MTTGKRFNLSKADLIPYPPHISHFLLATLLMMASHGITFTLAGHFFLRLSPAELVISVCISSLLFVFFNARIIFGHLTAQKGLKFLCAVYFVISTTALIDINQQGIPPVLAVLTLFTSSLAWLTIKGKRYQIMANHMARIWAFYRETGRTVLAEVTRQELQKQKLSSRQRHRV